MSHSRAAAATTLFMAIAAAACSDSSTDAGPAEAGAVDVGIAPDAGSFPDALPFRPDAELVVAHDSGGAPTCNTTCECQQGLACVNNECRAVANPVYCCEKPNCPAGQVCLDSMDRPDDCPSPPDAGPDAGAPDLGAGYVGASCNQDFDCTQVPGMTCWTRDEPPYFWGYCTVSPCGTDMDCPTNSHCLALRVGTCFSQLDCPTGSICSGGDCVVSGCLAGCTGEHECRSDAYCLPIPNLGYSICLPDCRDDVLDCAPRDGTVWCNRASGQCEPLAMQSSSALVGDACVSNADCGTGDVCMGEIAFPFPGGLCTRICSGLPEASSCDTATDSCNSYAGVGMCFRDCENNACPNRSTATCTELSPNWVAPGCVPL